MTIAAVVVLVGSAIFMFGEDLFGSDSGTIDSYNEEVLTSCEVPPGSTLVRTFVLRVYDGLAGFGELGIAAAAGHVTEVE